MFSMSTHRNYHDYDARQVSCFTIPGILTLLAIITYALRGFTRIKIVKHFGPEDWCCLVALCADIALTAIIFAETYYGMGLHIQDVDLATTSMMFKVGKMVKIVQGRAPANIPISSSFGLVSGYTTSP